MTNIFFKGYGFAVKKSYGFNLRKLYILYILSHIFFDSIYHSSQFLLFLILLKENEIVLVNSTIKTDMMKRGSNTNN